MGSYSIIPMIPLDKYLMIYRSYNFSEVRDHSKEIGIYDIYLLKHPRIPSELWIDIF